MDVVDLFCGMGGLSVGFKGAGFEVKGYEHNRHALASYRHNVGAADDYDLSQAIPDQAPDCVIGGPPCRPWSPINMQRRGAKHDDYGLVRSFDRTVLACMPKVFVLENVPLLARDPHYAEILAALGVGYDIGSRVVSYSDWGAASRRRRLFTIGIQKDLSITAARAFEALDARKVPAKTVGDAIRRFDVLPQGGFADHEWPAFKTIANYEEKYETGKFGWYKLKWDETAPSFGHVAKTYTLHPSGRVGSVPRVVSPREVMAILGFDDSYTFPEGVPRTAKYRMVADAVSPLFSRCLAEAIRDVLSQQ